MVAASTHHVVRVTVRISAAPIYRSVDVSLPTSSTLSEVLPELARLIELPQTAGRPWEFATAAGAPLDPHVPLHNMRLRDGQVLALRPHEPVDPPVVRDAAESLAAAAAATTRSGIDTAATFAGAAAAGILTASMSAPLAGAAVTALLLLVIAVAARSRAVFPAAACAASAVCGAWVSGIHDGTGTWPPATDLAYGAMTACVIAAALTVGGAVLGLAGPRVTSAALTSAALILAGSLAVWLPSPTAPYAAVVLAGIAAVMLTPSVATRAAGLRIPRVPTAGQEFGIADDYQDDVDARSDAARAITAGISVAAALCVIPALVVLARSGGGWVFALCLCTAGALIVHASRHHGTIPRLSLGSTAMLALTCGVTAVAVVDGAHPALLIAAGITALTAATAALWAARVPDLEPTTLVWLERAEAAAIIAVIPLAVKLTGIFDLIRGL
ncbi:type VII secretion integral membrane protein EccD [uncultured Corynebacterium sp.]|uniref:type VII secretion integral membrane protein EccD n=1 Tax=uncultured Corynebacterium sp. TaxID=159447 RepID=UPI0025E59D55|nr:type VII secretion integral membrane protein EccD [uncultured Corynebacterium sp.]